MTNEPDRKTLNVLESMSMLLSEQSRQQEASNKLLLQLSKHQEATSIALSETCKQVAGMQKTLTEVLAELQKPPEGGAMLATLGELLKPLEGHLAELSKSFKTLADQQAQSSMG